MVNSKMSSLSPSPPQRYEISGKCFRICTEDAQPFGLIYRCSAEDIVHADRELQGMVF